MRKAIMALVAAALLSLGTLGAVSATHWTSETFVPGNPTCEGGVKIEPVVDGTYPVPGGTITIDVTNTSLGPVFSFDADGFLVSSVIVKGGPNANLYIYEPPTDSDSGLHSPVNPNNGKYYGLSHLCFFGDEKKDPDPKK